MEPLVRIPVTVMRGGTSKGLIFKSIHLPVNPEIRDQIILRIFGSPDKRQIDGLGGGSPLTSKMAIVGPSTHPDTDVNYTFGQVSLELNRIDYKPTCGNMATAVGLFAAEEGYVVLTEPVTVVRIFNTNTGKIIETEIPVRDGMIEYDGDFAIDGVPGTATKIMVNFLDSGGGITGKLLPTGNAKDIITIEDGRHFDVTVLDSTNVVAFVTGEQLQLNGPNVIERFNDGDLLNTLEAIRVEVGVRIGLIQNKKEVSPATHALPKIAVLVKPQTYMTSAGFTIHENEVDIIGLYITMGQLHQALALSGAIAIATGAQIPGTVVQEMLNKAKSGTFKIGHPSGTMTVNAEVEEKNGQYQVTRAAIGRTARRLMDGYSYVQVRHAVT